MDLDKETRKQEDEYFARIEFQKRKKVLEEKQGRMKNEERKRLMEQHWMHCPQVRYGDGGDHIRGHQG